MERSMNAKVKFIVLSGVQGCGFVRGLCTVNRGGLGRLAGGSEAGASSSRLEPPRGRLGPGASEPGSLLLPASWPRVLRSMDFG